AITNEAKRRQLFGQDALVGFERAQRAPVSGSGDGGTNPKWTLVGVTGRFELGAPVLDVVAGARVGLHVVPVVAPIVVAHCLGEPFSAPLAQVVMSPKADRNAVYGLAT